MSSKTTLLIEDNRSDTALTKRALEKARIANQLLVAEDGQEAIDYLFGAGNFTGHDLTQQPALTLLDLKLPKISGLDVLRRIRTDPRTRAAAHLRLSWLLLDEPPPTARKERVQ